MLDRFPTTSDLIWTKFVKALAKKKLKRGVAGDHDVIQLLYT